MSETEGAAAPATEQAVSAPAAPEQATPTTSVPEGNAAPENAEITAQETQETTSEEPRRLSRSQRMQRKLARLSTMLTEREAELQDLRSKVSDGPKPPQEADFNGDYFAYNRALTKWDTEQTINSALARIAPAPKKPDVRELNKEEIILDLRERIVAAKEHLPDFEQSLGQLRQHVGDLSDALLEEIGESEKGEFILYHLAKNPELAVNLNRMSDRDAAREIARLEAKVSLPQPKRQTQAPAPLAAVKGGASPSKDIFELAKSEDASAFIEAERKRKSARA